jgi:hypothetical protein
VSPVPPFDGGLSEGVGMDSVERDQILYLRGHETGFQLERFLLVEVTSAIINHITVIRRQEIHMLMRQIPFLAAQGSLPNQ